MLRETDLKDNPQVSLDKRESFLILSVGVSVCACGRLCEGKLYVSYRNTQFLCYMLLYSTDL